MSSIEIKGSSFTFFVIRILSANPEQFARDFQLWMQKAPDFLLSAPVVLQPGASCIFSSSSLSAIVQIVRQAGCMPVALMTTDNQQAAIAKECGLAPITKDSAKVKRESFVEKSTPQEAAYVLSQTLRSGQQIYVKNRDLVVLGSVNHGAEVIADGSVHIYGSLRGKALAGAAGCEDEGIFVRDFRPQMVAIAGYYKILEDMPDEVMEKSIRVSLQEEQLSLFVI